MAKTVEVDLQVNSNIQGSIAELKALKRQLKDTAAGSAEFKALYNQIDDLEDKIKSSKNASSDWVDSLEQAGGPLGALGASLNKAKVATQSFGGALKATGIGLIVALVAGLAAAFNDNEKAQKKLQPLLNNLQKIFAGVFAVVEPLFDTLLDLATKALPYVSDAFKVVYSSVTAVFQSLGKLGSAVKKLIGGDFSGAWDDAKSSVTGFSKNFNDAKNRFEKGSKEMTATEKENAAKRAEALEKENEKKKAAEEKRLEAVKAHNQKLKEERERAAQEEAEFQKGHQEFLNQLDENAFAGKLAKGKEQYETQKAIDQENAFAEATAAADAANADDTNRIITFEKKKRTAEEEVAFQKAKDEAIANSRANLNNIIAGLEASGIAKTKAGQIISKAIALTQIGIDSAVAISKASTLANAEGVAAQLAFPLVPGIGTIARVVSYASTAASVIGNIARARQLLSSGSAGGNTSPNGSGGAAGGSTPLAAAPSFNVVGTSGQNQIAQTLGNQAPVKAYVVSNDVTSAQSLDRNIVKTATLGN